MKNLFMLIGLPRSGKTTWAKTKQEISGGVIVSADTLRWLVYGQRFWGEGEPFVWSIRGIVLKMLLEQGVNIIIDETNSKKERREPIIQMAKTYDYNVFGVTVNTALEECIKRAEKEGDSVIIPIIRRIYEQFEKEPPSLEEGFDRISKVSGKGGVE